MMSERIALVTGGNRGIGLQIARDLAGQGLTVLIGSRDLANGEAAARDIGGTARAIQLDVTDPASVTAAIEAVVRHFPEVVEYRSTISATDALSELTVELELDPGSVSQDVSTRVAQALRESMGLTVPVRVVDAGALPRFEMKARRFVVEAHE